MEREKWEERKWKRKEVKGERRIRKGEVGRSRDRDERERSRKEEGGRERER